VIGDKYLHGHNCEPGGCLDAVQSSNHSAQQHTRHGECQVAGMCLSACYLTFITSCSVMARWVADASAKFIALCICA